MHFNRIVSAWQARDVIILLLIILPAATSSASAQGTAILSGSISLSKEPPPPRGLVTLQNFPEFKGVTEVPLVADDHATALRDVVLWIEQDEEAKDPAETDKHATEKPKTAKEVHEIKVTASSLMPRVSVCRPGDEIIFKNELDFKIRLGTLVPRKFPTTNVDARDKSSITLESSNRFPTIVQCMPFSFIQGTIFVTESNSYYVTAADGKFSLKGLPLGNACRVGMWHRKCGLLRDIKLGKETAARFKQGYLEITPAIPAIDIGELIVPVASIAK